MRISSRGGGGGGGQYGGEPVWDEQRGKYIGGVSRTISWEVGKNGIKGGGGGGGGGYGGGGGGWLLVWI